MSLITVALMIYILTTLDAPKWCYVLLIVDFLITGYCKYNNYKDWIRMNEFRDALDWAEHLEDEECEDERN